MKLRNKKTGEIKDACEVLDMKQDDGVLYKYYSLAELNEEWGDYEEPKDVWWLDNEGNVNHTSRIDNYCFEKNKQIGNYFETREEAEKAVEKLKAWVRLKDKGFRFGSWNSRLAGEDHLECCGHINIDASIEPYSDCRQDLDLLFGGVDE